MQVHYPNEQMHRIAYTKLTERHIADRLRAAGGGPQSASPLSDVYVGESLRIVTDDGPTLEYRFASERRLTVSENGGDVVDAGYGALTMHDIAFVSHMLPGTQRGYHVIVDRSSGLATVFEVWFSGYQDNREVQREIYFGYVDGGGRAPEARHARTNRIEGKGYYWKQDTGAETLEFYPSTIYSNFVELSREGGELGYCAPSDYVRINDHVYVYSRTECEFSGINTTYVLDANTIEQVGARLGFDAADALEYYIFKGTGEWLGQLAKFEEFGDVGAALAAAPGGAPAEKGARRVYRPIQTYDILPSKEAVDAAVAASTSVFAADGPMAGNKLPMTDYLVGKELTLRYDKGPAIEYRFDEIQTLRWRYEGRGDWTEERYEAWESMPNVVMFGHLLSGAPDHDCQVVVADFDHGLVSLLHGTVGNRYIANETAVSTWFGVIEMEGTTPPMYRRHAYTDDLVGRAITWEYSPGLTSMHLYTTPHSLSWIIFGQDGAGGMEWSGPASYVKIRDGIYLAYWLEEACNGTLGMILVNMRTMHDCGAGFHCGSDGLRLSSMGALARHAGKFDVSRFYAIKG